MIYGYARVSTAGQKNDGNSLEAQEEMLRANGASDVFFDAYTGAKMDRPEFQKLLERIQPGDTLMATKLDRVSRSASAGIELVDSLLERGVNVHILNMGLMNNTSTGTLIRNIMFSFAQFERDMIRERTQEGKAVARMKPGYHEGRKPIDTPDFSKYLAMQQDGQITVEEACEKLSISRAGWYRRVKAVTA